MSLSVCLIVRNEERNLRRALTSVRDVADEIVVVDTGSTDATPAVASKFGARLGEFAWCDDFSAARNAALDMARCDWIFWLDADEELLASSVSHLTDAIADAGTLACLVVRRDLEEADRPDRYTEMWQLRLFRRRDDLRFVGRCHPHFDPPIEAAARASGLRVRPSQIALRHYGYVRELREAKLRRTLRLIELELEERPGQLYYMIERYRGLMLLQDARATEAFRQAAGLLRPRLADDRPPMPLAAQLLETLLQLKRDSLPEGITPETVRAATDRWFPDAPPLLWLRARQDFAEERYEEAGARLRRLLEMGRDHSYDKSVSFDPAILGDDARLNLAACLIRQAKLPEARRLLKPLRNSPDHKKAAAQNLEQIRALEKRFARRPAKRPKRAKARKRRRS